VLPDPLVDPARTVAVAAAAELRSLAVAVAALGDVDWQSPAAGAYRAAVEGLAGRTALVAAVLDGPGSP
jgi:hypothetical protein